MRGFRRYFEEQAEKVEAFRRADWVHFGSPEKNLSLRYYRKSKRRYRDSLSLAYPFLAKEPRSVLDLGGWEMGVLSRPLASSVHCVALDARTRELEQAFGLQVEAFDIMQPAIPLEGRSFDVVFFLEILEHLPPPVDHVMRRLHGLVRPGGLLVLSLPNLAFWQKRFKFFLFGRSPLSLSDRRDPSGGYDHIRPYTYDECMTLFGRYGLSVRAVRSGNYQGGWYNRPFHLLERAFPRVAHKLIFLLTPVPAAE